MNHFQVAVPTSFNVNETLNTSLTMQHVMRLYENGVRSVLVCGTTGEQHSLTLEEKCTLLDYINHYELPDDLELAFGVAATRQFEAVELTRKISENTNVSAILLGFPPYILPSQKDVLHYCTAIMEHAGEKLIILYNNPGRTGFDLSADSAIKLFENINVIGVKDPGDRDKIRQILSQIEREVLIFYGGDEDIPSAVKAGYNALSSIAGNIYPKETEKFFMQLRKGLPADEIIQGKINQLYNKPLLPYIKHLISVKEDIDFGKCRLPLGAGLNF